MMGLITDRAARELKSILDDEREKGREQMVRIFLDEINEYGPSFSIKLDDTLSDNDTKIIEKGIPVVFETSLKTEIGNLQIDYLNDSHCSGFTIKDIGMNGGCGLNCSGCSR
jgi:Fe-S cluster assembly iron-binding protein IscA